MLTKEECENACLYLLEHCYETDAPALENGDKYKTYTFTPAGFKESEIFKKLIEEHFNLKSLEFAAIKAGMWVYDLYSDTVIKVDETIVYRADYNVNTTQRFVKHMNAVTLCATPYKKGRFYFVQIPVLGGEK